MGAFIDTASAILSQAERRVEVAGQNIANIATPGYKRRVSFATALDLARTESVRNLQTGVGTNFAQGKIVGTNNPYDLAISGDGFFTVKTDRGTFYTRQGQFQIDADGRLVTGRGDPVQAQGGGDIVLKGRGKDVTVQIASDGTVTENGDPVGKLGIVDFTDRKAASYADDGMFTAPEGLIREVDTPMVRQGMLETSNVSAGDEMVSIMESMRRAEAGQKLVNVYDDLLGRALAVFGQA
jgi:flagellar basal-body rod protein FlgF